MISRNQLSAAIMITMIGVALSGCGGGKNTVATVGGNKLSVTDLDTRLAAFPAQYQDALKQKDNRLKILDQMIDEEVILVAAHKQGLDDNVELRKQIEASERQMILNFFVQEKIDKTISVTDDDLRQYFNNNSTQFEAAELRNLSHILVKTKAEAESVLRELGRGKDFAELAKEKSQDTTAQNGGQLGWIQRGQLVPPFEKAAFEVSRSGGWSDVVQTQFGFHVIRLNETRMRPHYEFEQVKEQIRQLVTAEKKKEATLKVLTELKEDIKVVRKDDNVK